MEKETDIQRFVEKLGSKKKAAEQLGVTPRYIFMLLKGRKPGKLLEKLIRIYLLT